MDHFLPLFAILGALLLGAISPGPSFVFVVRTAVAQSRTEGLAAALGMGVGAMLYGALAVLGLRTLMQDGGLLFTALKVAGGLYLVYLAWKIWSHAADPITVEAGAAPAANPQKAFSFGLLTQLANPKIVAVFGAVFAALLPANPEPWLYWALPPLIFLQETLWYSVVAVAFSAARPRALYLSAKLWVDRAAAAFIGILGIRLIIEAR
ncbi:MAG TPA: LysE family transporter [Devosia sp.]|jgi:threonine/homoserine/homoserine lactone efflux protein|uniref:LysE family translocator n=1 Tax=Devosia sp. TaxID=1871048 RepID=UPI002DDD25D7|nr:LysE family transporter [Devosia sp.]HEV2516371.1 LysE family transporter [Devosia sp.]